MDSGVMERYRQLIRAGFKNAGSFESPSIYLNTVAAHTKVCLGANGYIRIYINIRDGIVQDVKYLCSCDPVANVVVETFCGLARGKTLEAASAITPEMFAQAVGEDSEDLRKSAAALLKLWSDGVRQYLAAPAERH